MEHIPWGEGSRALLAMPVDVKHLAQIPADGTLELFGTPEPGTVIALRTGDLVITPAGKTKPPGIEDTKRSPHATIALTGPTDNDGDNSTPGPAIDGPLLRDAKEARRWARTTRVFGCLIPILILLPAVQILPDQLFWWGLAALFLALAIQFSILWLRRRLLNQLAHRLPGPPAVGRRHRLAARRAAEAYLASPAGLAEQAALLGVTTDTLEADRKRAVRRMIAAMAIAGLGFLALVVAGAIA